MTDPRPDPNPVPNPDPIPDPAALDAELTRLHGDAAAAARLSALHEDAAAHFADDAKARRFQLTHAWVYALVDGDEARAARLARALAALGGL